jgi:group I intron endonuclease
MGANQHTKNAISHLDIPEVCGIYLLTDTLTDKTYIGSSTNIKDRAIQHFSCMLTGKKASTYLGFKDTFSKVGSEGFSIKVLLICSKENLTLYEKICIKGLNPTENTQLNRGVGLAYSEEERNMRSIRTAKLWADPEYRERAINARKGNAYNKGYKCTPEQTKNRQRAARISNMKRNYGEGWKDEYVRRYPEHKQDVV